LKKSYSHSFLPLSCDFELAQHALASLLSHLELTSLSFQFVFDQSPASRHFKRYRAKPVRYHVFSLTGHKAVLLPNMELRSGRCLPLAPPARITRRRSRPFCLLDLLTELRLMIYGYVFGYENTHWTMAVDTDTYHTHNNEYMLTLGRPKGGYGIRPNAYLQKSRSSLLQTCNQISREALPILYNQTRFDIMFFQGFWNYTPSPYKLLIPNQRANPSSDGLTRVVLQRVKHVRFNTRCEQDSHPHAWQMQHLRAFLGKGAWLKSLHFVVRGRENSSNRNTWYAPDGTFDFQLFQGKASLVLCDYNNCSMTDEDITELIKGIRGTHRYLRRLRFDDRKLT
jgi:hypothetical protein